MYQQQQLSPDSALHGIPEFLENHHRASSRDRRPLVNGSSFDPPPSTSRHSRSRAPVVMLAQHRAPHRRTSTTTAASSSTEQNSIFDRSQYESDYSISEAPSLGPDPFSEGFGFLPCEFVGYTNCDFRYDTADTEQWMNHIIEGHLGWRLPATCACWYCDDYVFDTRKNGLDVISNFRERLYHIRNHIVESGYGITNIRPDYEFLAHLRGHGIISQSVYIAATNHREGPPSDVEGIYRWDFVPPEQQYQQDRSASLVVTDSTREEKRKGRRDRRRQG